MGHSPSILDDDFWKSRPAMTTNNDDHASSKLQFVGTHFGHVRSSTVTNYTKEGRTYTRFEESCSCGARSTIDYHEANAVVRDYFARWPNE